MTKLVLIRKYKSDSTQGLMLVMDGITELYRCFCLELPDFDNKHDISCIPEGTYEVIKYSYPRHPDVFYIQNVPDRTGIMIHMGNYVNGKQVDSKGCLLPGTEWMDIDGNQTTDIVHPDIAMANLNKYLPNKFKISIV